jgi:uncharacterized membrane protein YfcA
VLPELTLAQFTLLAALGVSVGAVGAMVGVGGGFLLVPALLIIFPDADPAVITSISLTAIVMNAASASYGYRRRGWQDGRTALILIATAVPVAIVGALLTRSVDRGAFDIAFGATLVIGAVYLAWRSGKIPAAFIAATKGRPRRLVDAAGVAYEYRVREPIAALIALGAGFMVFFGIGGGIVNVPLMMLTLKIPPRIAVATSQLELLFASGSATLVHLLLSFSDSDQWIRALIVGGGTLAGAQIGVRLAGHVSGRVVLMIIAFALVTAGIRQLVTGLN